MLEDELQLLESRITSDAENHQEEIKKLKAEYDGQISDKLRVIEELNAKVRIIIISIITFPI